MSKPSKKDPLAHLPSDDEVEASGTADWVDQALTRHQQRQDKLSSVFSDSKKELRDQKEKLASVWDLPPEPEADKGPDLFAQERAKNNREKAKLASIWDEDKAARAAEEDQLRNLFGPPSPKKRR
jgi:hypothetical protein